MKKKLQVYEAPEITVSFDPNVCKHTGVCLRTLPAVFDVRRPRWIQPGAEPTLDVAAAVQKCPSGALQFYRNLPRNPSAAAQLARRVLLNHLALCMAGPGSRAERAEAASAAIARERQYDYVGIYDVLEGQIALLGRSGDAPPEHERFPRDARSEMTVPVVDPSTRAVVGSLDVASNRPDAFGNEDRELMEDCADAIVELWSEE
jgi:uncharacterized Fe-S cluster protein YjdI/putative methionine-R-sulfoxide reductase with GAF domain